MLPPIILCIFLFFSVLANAQDNPHVQVYEEDIKKAQEMATHNLERYRSDVEALLSGRFDKKTGHIQRHPLISDSPAPSHTSTRLFVFVTLSMPDAALHSWIEQTSRAGGVVVIRGFYKNTLSATLKRINEITDNNALDMSGISINPMAFQRLKITHAPTIVLLEDALQPCKKQGCVDAIVPAHDRISGNTTLESALIRLSAEGEVARDKANYHLSILRGGE